MKRHDFAEGKEVSPEPEEDKMSLFDINSHPEIRAHLISETGEMVNNETVVPFQNKISIRQH